MTVLLTLTGGGTDLCRYETVPIATALRKAVLRWLLRLHITGATISKRWTFTYRPNRRGVLAMMGFGIGLGLAERARAIAAAKAFFFADNTGFTDGTGIE